MKNLGRLIRALVLFLIVVIAVPVVVALGGVAVQCRVFSGGQRPAGSSENEPNRPPNAAQVTAGLVDYERPEDQTYLTLPEWYIVYSADEYAAFIAQNPPSQFPYFSAIGQFWSSYYDVCAVTRERYAFNSGYHLTLAVIGVSFTGEYIVKGLYENTFGRLAEWASGGALTEEDVYARMVAAEYGTFLHTIPWYEFPFRQKLGELWSTTSWWGPSPLRKWDRKLALTGEYGTKAIYSWLIKLGTRSVFSPQDLKIQAWATGATPAMDQREPDLAIVEPIPPDAAIVSITRYEAFTKLAPRLMREGLHFEEIAGN
ncbi:MAG TPA: hypothetical protein VFX76_19040, partial [Roseiflexaceae bacterium]|nr:hypothetical protein [Roseiflexaceae bacterium]